jgi:uncharacterized protein YecT (DUF1311 family)
MVFECFSQVTDTCNYITIDGQLNKIYNQILKEYKNDTIFLNKLKTAQKAWIKFRDAQLEARFPSNTQSDKNEIYGSVYPMCACIELSKLTEDRIKQLQVWLNGVVEGDVCAGSYQLKK